MERNAHRLTLHSPATKMMPRNRPAFLDIAQTRGCFYCNGVVERLFFTTIYFDVTTT